MTMARKAARGSYFVLVAAGVAFALTACAYGVMTLRLVEPPAADAPAEPDLIQFMDRFGLRVMVGELAVLAVATVGAIVADHWGAPRPDRNSARRAASLHDSPERFHES